MLGKVVRVVCLLAILYFLLRCIDASSEEESITIKDTPVVIDRIKPIGQLYAFSAITEDYYIKAVEHVGFFRKSYYKTVQTLRMQISYVIDLDSVEYIQHVDSDTITIKLPKLKYIQSSQGGQMLCEVEESYYDASSIIKIVEEKIRSQYDNEENRKKAMQHVHEVLATFVQQCDLIPKFENN